MWIAAFTCSQAPPANVQLTPWKLEADDTKLLDLLPFLEAVVRTAVPDVRAVVRSYEGQDIPTAFRCGLRQDFCTGRDARGRSLSQSTPTSAPGHMPSCPQLRALSSAVRIHAAFAQGADVARSGVEAAVPRIP